MVEVNVEVLVIRSEAVLVTDGDTETWIPYSLIGPGSDIGVDSNVGDGGTLELPEWKALEEGLI